MKKNKKFMSLLLIFLVLLGAVALITQLNKTNNINIVKKDDSKVSLSGKYLSILGDSISTFKGYTDTSFQNTSITSSYLARYANKNDNDNTLCKLDSVNDTWWMQTANKLGMEICVNNSWRGTKILDDISSSGYGSRCLNLHDNTISNNSKNSIINPDIIAIYMGTNDYNANATLGSFSNIEEIYSSSTGYITPSSFSQAYAIMIHKIVNKYKTSDVYIFTLPTNSKNNNTLLLDQYNESIKNIAKYFNCKIVDIANISDYSHSLYTVDGLHPNEKGMDLITECFVNELKKTYK